VDFDFNRYIEDFNTNDDESKFVAKYYTEDLVVDGPQGTMHGRQAWIDMLGATHVGIKERLQPIMVAREGDKVMAESNATFTASRDRLDFPFGPLKKGESVTVRFFASYRLRGHQIAHLTLGFWLPSMRKG